MARGNLLILLSFINGQRKGRGQPKTEKRTPAKRGQTNTTDRTKLTSTNLVHNMTDFVPLSHNIVRQP